MNLFKKIAVCFSGQARHWKSCEKNIKKFFDFSELGIETDYFIHTWDTNTWRYPKTNHTIFHTEKHNDKEDIIECYKPKGFIQEEFVESNFIRAWDPMFYSFEKSMMLKRQYELEKDFEYDVVIKARLDVIYNPEHKFPLIDVQPGVCYTCYLSKFPMEFNANNFDDVIFYGNSPTMDIIGDIYLSQHRYRSESYLRFSNTSTNLNKELWLGPGCMLYNYMSKLSIHPECKNPFEYVVVRSTMVDEKLDCINDYLEMQRKGRDWYI